MTQATNSGDLVYYQCRRLQSSSSQSSSSSWL